MREEISLPCFFFFSKRLVEYKKVKRLGIKFSKRIAWMGIYTKKTRNISSRELKQLE